MGRTLLQIANGLVLILFVWAAVVQYNDPDGLLWVAIYGGAALCCVLYAAGRLPTSWALVVSVISTLWGLYLLLRIFGFGAFFDTTGNEMMGLMEESREMLGLFIIAAWCGFLAWRTRRSANAPASSPVS